MAGDSTRDEFGRRWVVVEAESRPGKAGGTEPLVIEELAKRGIAAYWLWFLHEIKAHPRNGRRAYTVKRGVYAPWLFAAVWNNPADDVARIRATKYVADVLWTEADQHYMPAAWLAAVWAGRSPPGSGAEPPCIIDPVTGRCHPLEFAGRRHRFNPGDRVYTGGKWGAFERMIGGPSVVVQDSGRAVQVRHLQVLGTEVVETYDPVQVEASP